jgi:predicted aminopeptidase
VTHVLSASARTELLAYTWWFPIAGEVPYKSFFDEQSALAAQAELLAAGYDTWLGRSTAYSTLGFFRDPITDTMLQRGVIGLVDVLIHELAHARLYVPGETDFNEQLASFVGRQGSLQYFSSRSDGDPIVMAAVHDYFDRKREVELLMEAALHELQRLYASGRPGAEILRLRRRVFARVERDLAALYPDAAPEELRVNTARLLQFARYAGSTEYLERLWQDAGRNWVAFWPAVERYAEREL